MEPTRACQALVLAWLVGGNSQGGHWPHRVPFQECTDGYEWDADSQHCRGESFWGTSHLQELGRGLLFPRDTLPPIAAAGT